MRDNGTNQDPNGKTEHGSAMLMAIIVLVLLAGMGISLLFLSQNEVRMSQASLRTKQAFYLAEAGIEDGRLTLFNVNGNEAFDDDLATAAGSDGKFLDPDKLRPTYDSSGNLTGISGDGDDVPLRPVTAMTFSNEVQGWYSAYLTNDPQEYDSVADTNERVMLTAVGAGPGGAFEVVQAILERELLTPPIPPAAITMLGSNPQYEGGSSGAKEYSGTDCNGDGVPGLVVPTVGVIGSTAKQNVLDNLGDAGTYNAGGYEGGSTVADLTDPDEYLSGSVDPMLTDCWALREFMEQVRDGADVYCDPGTVAASSCNLGATTPESVIFVDGNWSAVDGSGTLAVTKQLTAGGGWNWSGLILVVGHGDMRRSGGGPGIISGGVVIANISGPDGELFTADDCSEGDGGFADAMYETNGGGSSTVTFCLQAMEEGHPALGYTVIDFLQR